MEIFQRTVLNHEPVEHLFYKKGGETYASPDEIPFIAKQTRIVLENCGKFDAESLDEYIASGGYDALTKALFDMTPEDVLEEVDKSQIKGSWRRRFPGRKKVETGGSSQRRAGSLHCLQRRRR